MSTKSQRRRFASPLSPFKIFPAPPVAFSASCIDLDGDGVFSAQDLYALNKQHFIEHTSLGDGHCFFRVLHRFMNRTKQYTSEELMSFKSVRESLHSDSGIFPEIAYLRRLAQKFCSQIHINKYGRVQEHTSINLSYAAESQAYGLLCARRLSGTCQDGYADSPDYEACATVLGITICILQTDKCWQVFPDNTIVDGFGNNPVMFAYNKSGNHFNALEPNMCKIQERQKQIEQLSTRSYLSALTLEQSCRIVTYFFKAGASIHQLDKEIVYIKRRFRCSTDIAIEMIHVRRPTQGTIIQTINSERKLMSLFSDEMFVKLLTYGNVKTKAGFKSATSLLKYLAEKKRYLTERDGRRLTIQQVAVIYLNGD